MSADAVSETGVILESHNEVLDAVEEIIRGTPESDPVTSGEIKDRLHISDRVATPKTRELVREVIEMRNLPIGSSTRGYWHIRAVDELERTLAGLESRRESIREREREIVAAYNRSDGQ